MKTKYVLALLATAMMAASYAAGYSMASDWESEVVTHGYGADAVNANADGGVIVKKSAEYIVETCRSGDETGETVEKLSVPVEFMGLTREEIIQYIEEHQSYFDIGDDRAINVMLVSFSADRVVIRRNVECIEETETYSFAINDDEPKYYILIEDSMVTVYRGDKTTVYMETGITVDELEPEIAAELSRGVAVKNISELYRLLESYTS